MSFFRDNVFALSVINYGQNWSYALAFEQIFIFRFVVPGACRSGAYWKYAKGHRAYLSALIIPVPYGTSSRIFLKVI